jgi:SAM-dependent methyltransferase
MAELYSLENARRFQWASVDGTLNPGRVSYLEKYLLGNRVLDAGCGGGAYVDRLSRMGYNAAGVDKHPEFLALARERAYAGEFVQADITRLPFPANTFDSSFSFDVLEHVDDRAALAELVRVTTQRIIVAVPKADEGMTRYGLTLMPYQDTSHLRYYTESSLEDLVSCVGATHISIFPEQQVAMKALVQDMVRIEQGAVPLGTLGTGLASYVLRKLLGRATYTNVYTGLVAVVDLA